MFKAQCVLQIGVNKAAVSCAAAVKHHDFAITLDNGCCALSYIEKVDRQVALRKRGCVYENACHYKQHTDQLPKKVSHIQRLPLQGRLCA